jgi:hypothetical protein
VEVEGRSGRKEWKEGVGEGVGVGVGVGVVEEGIRLKLRRNDDARDICFSAEWG